MLRTSCSGTFWSTASALAARDTARTATPRCSALRLNSSAAIRLLEEPCSQTKMTAGESSPAPASDTQREVKRSTSEILIPSDMKLPSRKRETGAALGRRSVLPGVCENPIRQGAYGPQNIPARGESQLAPV